MFHGCFKLCKNKSLNKHKDKKKYRPGSFVVMNAPCAKSTSSSKCIPVQTINFTPSNFGTNHIVS